jgi:hypothetical protein
MQARLDRMPDAMGIRRQAVEHPFATLKSWMDSSPKLASIDVKARTEVTVSALTEEERRVRARQAILEAFAERPRWLMPSTRLSPGRIIGMSCRRRMVR